MQKVEKSEKIIKKEKQKKGKIIFLLFLLIIVIGVIVFVMYYEKLWFFKSINKSKIKNVSTTVSKNENITFENSELKDVAGYSYDDANIYAVFNDNATKKIYTLNDNNKKITSLVYKEGILYLSLSDDQYNNEVMSLNLNKGNGKYDLTSTTINGNQLTLVGIYDKYLYYYKSFSRAFENGEYGFILYQYNLDTKTESKAIDDLSYNAKISVGGKIYYTKVDATSVKNKTVISKMSLYSYDVTSKKSLLIDSMEVNDYEGNVVPFEALDLYKKNLVYTYQTRNKVVYNKYNIDTTDKSLITEEDRYNLSCDNDTTYLICLRSVPNNKKDLLIYNISDDTKVYESNNVTDGNLEEAYVVPNGKFNTLNITFGANLSNNVYDLTNQKFISSFDTGTITILKDN